MMSTEERVVRLIVADDHRAFRSSVTAALSDTTIDIIAVLGDGATALAAARALRPDVALLDLNMPILSGAEVARQLRQEGNPTKVIILSGYTEPQIVAAALKAGAVAFLSKEATTAEIIEAIERSASLRRFPDPDDDAL
jgi:two-component system, NarL family, response regulator DesR